jgi:hypothetical protein
MSMARTVRLAGLLAVALAGCVDRKFVVESNVPSAQVYVDNRPAGAAPAYVPFEYYGYYNVTLVHPGYETVVKRVHVIAPWYAYPPFDLLAELLPFHVRDTRRYTIDMAPAPQSRADDILVAADALRQRGMSLPPPERPAAPRPANGGQPLLGPPVGTLPLGPAGPVAPDPGVIPSPLPPPSPVPRVTPN